VASFKQQGNDVTARDQGGSRPRGEALAEVLSQLVPELVPQKCLEATKGVFSYKDRGEFDLFTGP